MKYLCLFLSFFLSFLFTGCTSNVKDNVTETPTIAPNAAPYAVYYNDQLYLYESEYSFIEENISELVVLGEIIASTTGDQLPSSNNQTNIEFCTLPTPLLGISSNATKIIMEVNTDTSNNVNIPYSHTYYLFSLSTTGN